MIIAVWGSPNSGKTTTAISVAKSLTNSGNTCVVIFADMNIPHMPVIFPERNLETTTSIGKVLSMPDLNADSILRSILTSKKNKSLGFSGYLYAENELSYPYYTMAKASEYLKLIESIIDYIVVDCTSHKNILSDTALELAENILFLSTPDLKSINYINSKEKKLEEISLAKNIVQILSIVNNDQKLPISDMLRIRSKIGYTFQYDDSLKEAMHNGELAEASKDKNKKVIDKIIKSLTSEIPDETFNNKSDEMFNTSPDQTPDQVLNNNEVAN